MSVRRLARTGMSLAMFVGLGGLSAAAFAQTATHTTLTAETREIDGHTVATLHTSVLAADGSPAAGKITLIDAIEGHSQSIAAAALDSEGKVDIQLDSLAAGDHSLHVVFSGDSVRAASQSESVVVHPQVTGTPDFTLAIAPTSISLAPGQATTFVTTITPVNSFTGFLSLSCSGTAAQASLPVGVSCTYAPANLQVSAPSTANPTAVATADLSLQTTAPAGQTGRLDSPNGKAGSPLVLAILLPGLIGLGLLGRKRKLLARTALVVMIGAVSLLGATACAARYRYLNHPPTPNNGTPKGNYTITITAQTSNGVTAAAHSTTIALTVN